MTTEAIPNSLCKLQFLTGLWLNNFKIYGGGLTGSIPSCLGNLGYLQYHIISSRFPCMTFVRYLFLSGNKLTGGVPAAIFNLTNMLQLFLGDNSLGGTIPNQVGNLGTNITVMI